MKHLNFNPTPLTRIASLSDELGAEVFFKREDLFEKAGGGSKARMLQYILSTVIEGNYDYVLTAGGPYSNFNRALALMCGPLQIKIRIVLYNKNKHIKNLNLNKKICDICDVEYVNCEFYEVAETIRREEKALITQGRKPFFIWGGGKSEEGIYSYFDCMKEIRDQISGIPDYIFTPVGTGTTYAGLFLGCQKFSPHTKVIGISVARTKKTSETVILDLIKNSNYLYVPDSSLRKIEINDDYLCGGYGFKTKHFEDFLKETIKKSGFIMDPIYVGKALYGFYNMVKKNPRFQNKKIVFLNTGGFFNLD